MVQSRAATVEEYLKELPAERRRIVSTVRDVVRRHLPAGYEETMGWGMIAYGIPLSRYPNTYNGQPLCYVALAAQKNHYALYLMGAYSKSGIETALREGFARAGKKLDKGQSCVRFKQLEDLPLDVIGQAIESMPPEQLMQLHDESHGKSRTKISRETIAKNAAAKKAAKVATKRAKKASTTTTKKSR